jgi:hypothetical protein
MGSIVLLGVAPATHNDILTRIEKLGPIYRRDFLTYRRDVGTIIVFGEVGLVIERQEPGKVVEPS